MHGDSSDYFAPGYPQAALYVYGSVGAHLWTDFDLLSIGLSDANAFKSLGLFMLEHCAHCPHFQPYVAQGFCLLKSPALSIFVYFRFHLGYWPFTPQTEG